MVGTDTDTSKAETTADTATASSRGDTMADISKGDIMAAAMDKATIITITTEIH